MIKHSDQFSKALCFALLLFISTNILAQNKVTGRIVNQGDNQPIAGATVQEKGSTNATQTMNDGTFTITVPGNATLVITVVGYTPQEVAVGGKASLSISMTSGIGWLSRSSSRRLWNTSPEEYN